MYYNSSLKVSCNLLLFVDAFSKRLSGIEEGLDEIIETLTAYGKFYKK